MALSIGSLYVSLNANANAFIKGFRDATMAAEKAAKEIKRVSGEVAQVSTVFVAVAGAAVKLASSVNGQTKVAMDGLEKATKLLAVQVAVMLLPAVNALTKMLKDAAAVIAGLSPEVKAMVSTFAVWAVQALVVGKALMAVSGGVSSVLSIVKGLSSAVLAIGVGPLLNIVIAVGLIIGAVLLLHRAWRKNWGDIQTVTADVLNWFHDSFGQFADFMSSVWSHVLTGAESVVNGFLKVGEAIERITGRNLGLAGLREGFKGLFNDLRSGSFFSDAFKFGKSVGSQLVDGISEEWAALKQTLGLDKLGLNRGPTPIGIGPRASMTSGHEGVATYALAAQEAAAARALKDITTEAARFKKSLADVDAAGEVKKWLTTLNKDSVMARGSLGGNSVFNNPTWTAAQRGQSPQQLDSVRESARSDAVAAGSWGVAQKALHEGMKGAENFGDTLAVWGARMGPMLAQSGQQLLGAVGDLVSSVVQGAQQGGVWGAILAAFMEIAKKTASALAFLDVAMTFVEKLAEMVEPLVAPIFDALTEVLGIVLEIVAPVFEALGPLFTAIFNLIKSLYPILYAIGDVLYALGPIIELVGNVVGVIFKALEPIFEIIGGVLKAVATVILGIIIFINEIAAALGDTKARAEADRMKKKVEEMWNRDASASGIAAGAALKKATADEKAATAANKLAESLTNLPSGYRVQMARYDADLGLTSAGVAGAGGGGGTTIISGNIYVSTNGTLTEAEQLVEEIKNEQRRNRGQTNGNPTGSGRGRNGDDW